MNFEDWWGDEPSPGRITAKDAWAAGQAAERERVKQIVDAVGWKVKHDAWLDCLDVIMERIEE